MGKFDTAFAKMNEPENDEQQAARPTQHSKSVSRTQRQVKQTKSPEPQPAERGRGRPATGKRSNPNYGRLTVYLPNDLRTRAERKWQDTTGSREASDLVEHLLTTYVSD